MPVRCSRDLEVAYPPFEFEDWAIIALGGVPNFAKNERDTGILEEDGQNHPANHRKRHPKTNPRQKIARAGRAGNDSEQRITFSGQ